MIKEENTNINPSSKLHGDLELIRLPELCKLSTLKPSTVAKAIRNKSMPLPFKILGVNVWSKLEVISWIYSQRQ
jgi:predicted DNA-binding transcriptional regulator AlpA